MSFDKDFLIAPVADMLEDNLFTITDSKREAVVAIFMDWLSNYAKLKPVPNLQQRIMDMQPKLRKMAKNLEVSITGGKLVIRSDADSEMLLNLFRRGSNWFNPHPDVNAAILLALADGANAT